MLTKRLTTEVELALRLKKSEFIYLFMKQNLFKNSYVKKINHSLWSTQDSGISTTYDQLTVVISMPQCIPVNLI